MFKLLDLFSGIGGFSLGLERSGGFKTVAFCEIEPFCRRVLKKHWPEVPCYEDITTLTGRTLQRDGVAIDAICGGFPCQDISNAGKGAGIATGTRSGLWVEYARLIGELRPKYVIVENVAALLGRGLDRVLGDLATLGYDAEWHCIPASAVGAPHRRDRIWIVAYTKSNIWRALGNEINDTSNRTSSDVANANGSRRTKQESIGEQPRRTKIVVTRQNVANTSSAGLEGWTETLRQKERWNGHTGYFRPCISFVGRNDQWNIEPNVGRVADGISNRMDKLKALGNAVVPQIPEIIGRAIMEAECRTGG